MKHYVIIGLGTAGATAAKTLRRNDPEGRITILNGEPYPFYLRLDLKHLPFDKTMEELMPRPEEYWKELRVEVVQDRAESVDPDRREIRLASGSRMVYDRMLVCTGTTPRRLECPGSELEGIHTYWTMADVLSIQDRQESARQAVIVGGGILGLEVARIAVRFGWRTTLLVRRDHVGSPLLDRDGADYVQSFLDRAGVDVRFGETVNHYEGENGRLSRIVTNKGRETQTDIVIECIGVKPAVGFLQGASVLTEGELVVDEHLQSPVEGIFGAGDCATVRTEEGRSISCRTWAVATQQGRVAADNMTGKDLPWSEGVPVNQDAFFDQDFMMIGPWEIRREAGRTVHRVECDSGFRAITTRDGIIESALLITDRSGDRRVRKLIAQKAKVEGKLDLVFNPEAKPEDFQ